MHCYCIQCRIKTQILTIATKHKLNVMKILKSYGWLWSGDLQNVATIFALKLNETNKKDDFEEQLTT